jgi:uncharacterized membrane protein
VAEKNSKKTKFWLLLLVYTATLGVLCSGFGVLCGVLFSTDVELVIFGAMGGAVIGVALARFFIPKLMRL